MTAQTPPPTATIAATPPGPAMVRDDLDKHLFIGFATAFLLVGGLGVWASTASLSGAVVSQGTVVVDTNVKKVQHPTGGVVGEIRVREGDKVKAGDLVMRLDETIMRANLGIVTGQLDEFAVRQARLRAERDGLDRIDMPASLAQRGDTTEIKDIISGERMLFASRRSSRDGQKAQLNERVNQLTEEIGGLEAQRDAKAKEVELINRELREIEKLWARNLTPLSKLIALQREATRVEGERGHLVAAMAQAKAKISETRLQVIQLDQDLRTEVTRDLREIQAKQAELIERRVAAEDQLKRIDIRAPQTGVVHQLTVHTVGGVISPSEPVMLIVPQGEALMLEAKIAPQDIAQVRVGQPAYVRFTAFNQRTTPELQGFVSRVSADSTREQQSNVVYYTARIGLSEAEMKQLGELQLMPGMPAEVYIRTEERTAMSYFMKPLYDQFARAFNER